MCLILCSWDWLHKSVPALHLLQHKPRCTELRTNLNVEQVQLNTTWERGTEGAKLGAATEGMWPTPVTRMASAWCYAEETLKWLPTRQLQAVVPKAVAAGRKREVPRSWWCSLAIPAVHTLWDSMLQQIQTYLMPFIPWSSPKNISHLLLKPFTFIANASTGITLNIHRCSWYR